MAEPKRRKKNLQRKAKDNIRSLEQLREAIKPLLPTKLEVGNIKIDLSSVITEKEAHEASLLLGIIIREHFQPLLTKQGLAVTKTIGLGVGPDRVLRGRIKKA